MTFCVYACGVWVGVCVGVRLCSRICVWLVCLAAFVTFVLSMLLFPMFARAAPSTLSVAPSLPPSPSLSW
jgi:choline-glycine betaine transporter